MTKQDDSPLVLAANAFDEQLAAYARLGELFLETPLTTVKHLERANQALADIAACEARLQQAGSRLIEALGGARQHQEQLAHEVIAHAPTVQARNAQLAELMAAMGQLATDAAQITAMIGAKAGEPADPGAVSTAVLDLSERAERLAASARDAQFEELASQAHALHQRLEAIGGKLQKAGRQLD